jgi:hypothetical protein
MRTRYLNGLIAAILLISTGPLYAQGAQPDTANLARQLERADQEKDRKKITVLSQKINQLQKLVGPEFLMLVNILKHLDVNSPDGREIALIIQSLNQSCPD